MEGRKGQRYSNEFRRGAVEQVHGCDNRVRLARELGHIGRGLYNSRDRWAESNPPAARTRERILRKQILGLKQPKFLDMETSLTILAAAMLTEFSSYGNLVETSPIPQVLGRPRKTKE